MARLPTGESDNALFIEPGSPLSLVAHRREVNHTRHALGQKRMPESSEISRDRRSSLPPLPVDTGRFPTPAASFPRGFLPDYESAGENFDFRRVTRGQKWAAVGGVG